MEEKVNKNRTAHLITAKSLKEMTMLINENHIKQSEIVYLTKENQLVYLIFYK